MDSIIVNGVERFFGNQHPDGHVPRSYRWTKYGSTPNTPIIDKSKWKDVDLSQFLPPVKDQDGIGACNAFATVEVAETCRAVQGLTYVELSPGWLYGNINGQRDQGSLLEDAMAYMVNYGTCRASTVGPLDWQKSKWSNPSQAQKEAIGYRFLECYVCPSGNDLIASMVSSLQEGFVLDTGALWYQSYEPDADGKLPKSKKGLAGGHAFMVYGCRLEPDGVWFRMRNSWGGSWGQSGSAWIHETAYTSDIGGIYACRSVSDAGGGFPAPAAA